MSQNPLGGNIFNGKFQSIYLFACANLLPALSTSGSLDKDIAGPRTALTIGSPSKRVQAAIGSALNESDAAVISFRSLKRRRMEAPASDEVQAEPASGDTSASPNKVATKSPSKMLLDLNKDLRRVSQSLKKPSIKKQLPRKKR